jgi:hypothetical protein
VGHLDILVRSQFVLLWANKSIVNLEKIFQRRVREKIKNGWIYKKMLCVRFDPTLHQPDCFFLGGTGAGEGVRTLDPNLGKVVLYH